MDFEADAFDVLVLGSIHLIASHYRRFLYKGTRKMAGKRYVPTNFTPCVLYTTHFDFLSSMHAEIRAVLYTLTSSGSLRELQGCRFFDFATHARGEQVKSPRSTPTITCLNGLMICRWPSTGRSHQRLCVKSLMGCYFDYFCDSRVLTFMSIACCASISTLDAAFLTDGATNNRPSFIGC